MAPRRDRLAVSIITGFLGAGKSTLLNRVLKDPAMNDAAIIINEFGEVGIDHLLVTASDDSIIELSDGCLCCTIRGTLVDTLAMIMDTIQTGGMRTLSRVVVETTGLADPAPVMQSVMGHPVIAESFELEGVVTVVDGVNGLATIERYPEALKQVAVADKIVLSKLSMSDGASVDALRTRLKALNPKALLVDADGEAAGRVDLFENGLYDPATKTADVGRWLKDEAAHDHGHRGHHHHDHDHGHHEHDHDINRHGDTIRSYSLMHDRPIDPKALEMFIDLLRSAHGEKILRMKAVVALSDHPERPLVLHGVQSVFHRPERLDAWPDPADRRTRLVLITDGLEEAYVRDLFDAFVGKPVIDHPDRAALEDNPLAVAGFKF
ncbi:GTP-binding protein [Ciceribacter sp. L1K23]|uniref:CobW family GTP-binding protein n=1 Tax=Ciceribacter sp. L1K23 TaxID=2820276 RepID=UPI001B813F28|nr:GTP-binding protein [Ciceribacter sp. L1K23]MBR0554218.1 GTP-binding protein [Ciceribacter sp. L1K23]